MTGCSGKPVPELVEPALGSALENSLKQGTPAKGREFRPNSAILNLALRIASGMTGARGVHALKRVAVAAAFVSATMRSERTTEAPNVLVTKMTEKLAKSRIALSTACGEIGALGHHVTAHAAMVRISVKDQCSRR